MTCLSSKNHPGSNSEIHSAATLIALMTMRTSAAIASQFVAIRTASAGRFHDERPRSIRFDMAPTPAAIAETRLAFSMIPSSPPLVPDSEDTSLPPTWGIPGSPDGPDELLPTPRLGAAVLLAAFSVIGAAAG